MNITECPWEIKNLNKRVVEVTISENDFDINQILELEKSHDYIAVKVEVNKPNVYIKLQELGFYFIESQLSISKKVKDLNINDKTLNYLTNNYSIKDITTKACIDELLSKLTNNTFSTDRIYIDPQLGPNLSLNRYRNWIASEYLNSKLSWIVHDNEKIGFALYKVSNGSFIGLLGGVFDEYQGCGHGIATAMAWYLYYLKNKNIKSVKTKISSNNTPMLQLYNYYNFKIESIHNVFIKHLKV